MYSVVINQRYAHQVQITWVIQIGLVSALKLFRFPIAL